MSRRHAGCRERQRGIALASKLVLVGAIGAGAGFVGGKRVGHVRALGGVADPGVTQAIAAQMLAPAAPAWQQDAQAAEFAEIRRLLNAEPPSF